jgi:hypothetical protein
MLQVVGGTYFERCHEGEWSQLYGSGLRASAAVSALERGVSLSTYVDLAEATLLKAVARTFNIQLQVTAIPATVTFSYAHGLSTPTISPALHRIVAKEPLLVEGERILRFGFLEGDAVVRGSRVIYDPQSAFNPQLFHTNGSQATALAIVCNAREAVQMTGLVDVEAAAKALCEIDSAAVVVVKRGSKGALVAYEGALTVVPAFRTARVWPIGSGDVFAAIFAHYWATLGVEPIEAAQKASLATAYYCETRSLPIPDSSLSEIGFAPHPAPIPEGGTSPVVYLAGPFFNMAERWLVNEAREALLDQGVAVFSPKHDVGLGHARDVVPADVKAINDCTAMIALLPSLDAGTIFEVGYARAIGKPVVVFAQNVSEESMKMLDGTHCDICDDFVSCIYRVAWAANAK